MSKESGVVGREGFEMRFALNPVSILTGHSREHFNIFQLESLKSHPPVSLTVTLHHGVAGRMKL